MPSLPNQKHERFAQAMSLEGAEQRGAYLAAGFQTKSEKAADASASKLMRRPEVKARIAELRTARVESLVNEVQAYVGPLDKEVFTRVGRAKILAETARKLDEVIAARANAEEHQDIPGGKTGLVVLKGVKKDGSKISAVDTKMLQERRSTFEQIARELGQWVEKKDETLEIRHMNDLTDDQLRELAAEAFEMLGETEKEEARKVLEMHKQDPGDEEPTGAGEPVVTYAAKEDETKASA